MRIPQGSLSKSLAASHFSRTLNMISETALGLMNVMGPCFGESLHFKDFVGRQRRYLSGESKVKHQMCFALKIKEEKLTVKQVSSWHLLLKCRTVTFILAVHCKVCDYGHSKI